MNQLLVETHVFKPTSTRLSEGKSDRGLPIVEGILATCEVKNGNGRYYSRELWEREMEAYKNLIDEHENIYVPKGHYVSQFEKNIYINSNKVIELT